MSTFVEKRRPAAGSDNLEKRPRDLRTADRGKHIDFDELNRLIELINALRDRYTNILEPKGRRSAGVRQDARGLTLRRARNSRTRDLGDEIATVDAGLEVARESGAALSPTVKRANAISGVRRKVANPWRLLSAGTAAIVAGGLVGALVASKGFWDEAFSSCQTMAVRDATEFSQRLPRGQNGSSPGLLQSALVDKVEHPRAVSQGRQIASPAGSPRNDGGAAIDPGDVLAPPAQANEDAPLSYAATTASLPLAPAVAAASASISKATPAAQTTKGSALPESRDLGYPASAMAEAGQRSTSAHDDAPPLDRSSAPKHSEDGAVDKELNPSARKNGGACFVKVEGRVYVNGSCHVSRNNGSSVTFGLAKRPVTITFDHGRTWTATMGRRRLGKVLKGDSCWGNKRVYICEHAI